MYIKQLWSRWKMSENILLHTMLRFENFYNSLTRVPEVIQGRGGASCERGIQGTGGKSRAAGANRGQWGWIVQKRHFAMFCYYNSLLILAQSKHIKFGTLFTLVPAVLHPWLNLSILIEEIPSMLTILQTAYGRAHAGTPSACRNGFCLNFTGSV